MASKIPAGDVWNIIDNDEQSQWFGRTFRFDFSYISNDEIKEIYKDYIWQNYKVGNKTIYSLYNDVNTCFRRFVRFADIRNLSNLKNMTNIDVEKYMSFLRTFISEITGKPISSSSQKEVLFLCGRS